MAQIKDLSLRKTILLYLCIALTCSFFVSYFIVSIADREQMRVWDRYSDSKKFNKLEEMIGTVDDFEISVMRPSSYIMTDRDLQISEACDAVNTWTPLILSTLSAALAVFLFYKHKLKTPIRILEESSSKIAQSSLDFHVDYNLKDEMGRLCTSFEHMRQQLEYNNKSLWKTIDEQKKLKAAIAHDIRAPLAVLKGYHEMLLEFVPQDKIDRNKLIEIIEAGSGQVDRLAAFVETMKHLSSLEDRTVNYDKINTPKFTKQLKETSSILSQKSGIKCSVFVDPSVPEWILGDLSMIREVYENLLSNAIRFASDTITIAYEACGNQLWLTVSDDGAGFKEECISIVTNAYFHDNLEQTSNHYGLGLYLCKILCEKHGGKLIVANNSDKGASIKAIFEIHSIDNADE